MNAFVSNCLITVAAAFVVAAVRINTEVFLHFILYKKTWLLLATLLLPFMIWTVIIDNIGFLQSFRILHKLADAFPTDQRTDCLFHRVDFFFFICRKIKTD